MRQFSDYDAPLTTGLVFHNPSGASFESASTGGVGIGNLGRGRSNLTAPGKVWALNNLKELRKTKLGVTHQRNHSFAHFR